MKLNSWARHRCLLSLLVISGCDQVEKSAQQVMGKAAESAKQAIDETHKAAEQALSEATQGLISPQKKDDQEQNESESNSKES
jgi:hypothetical protein